MAMWRYERWEKSRNSQIRKDFCFIQSSRTHRGDAVVTITFSSRENEVADVIDAIKDYLDRSEFVLAYRK